MPVRSPGRLLDVDAGVVPANEEHVKIGFLYSVISYAGFLAVFTYFAWFSAGAFVPRSVNYMRCQASTPKFLPIGAPVPPRSTEQGAA